MLNRISGCPVPDGDTGTTFTLSLRAVADALRVLGDATRGATATTGARGARVLPENPKTVIAFVAFRRAGDRDGGQPS